MDAQKKEKLRKKICNKSFPGSLPTPSISGCTEMAKAAHPCVLGRTGKTFEWKTFPKNARLLALKWHNCSSPELNDNFLFICWTLVTIKITCFHMSLTHACWQQQMTHWVMNSGSFRIAWWIFMVAFLRGQGSAMCNPLGPFLGFNSVAIALATSFI